MASTSEEKLSYLAQTKQAIQEAINGKGQVVSDYDTFRSYAEKIANISKDATAQPSDMLEGETAYSGGTKITGTIKSKQAETFLPSTEERTIPAGLALAGAQVIAPVGGNATKADVLAGKTFSSGSGIDLTGTIPVQTVLSKTLKNQNETVQIPAGYYEQAGSVKAVFDHLTAENVKKGVVIGGVTGTAETETTNQFKFVFKSKFSSVLSGWTPFTIAVSKSGVAFYYYGNKNMPAGGTTISHTAIGPVAVASGGNNGENYEVRQRAGTNYKKVAFQRSGDLEPELAIYLPIDPSSEAVIEFYSGYYS